MTDAHGPITILLNPAAGAGLARRMQARLEEELKRLEVPYSLIVTQSEDHLRELTRKLAAAGPADRVLAAAGGDSTFQIIAGEILARKAGTGVTPPILSLIGLGSSNDIPAAFGLTGLETACRVLRDGRVRRIDAGVVLKDGEAPGYFLGQANVGLGAAVNRFVFDLAGRRPAWARRQTLAGVLGIRRAYQLKDVPIRLSVEWEGGRLEGPFTLAVFANTRVWATGRIIAPEADPQDGCLDACFIAPCSMRRLARLYGLTRTGAHTGQPEVRIVKAKAFTLRTEYRLDVQTDGEIIEGTPDGAPRTITVRAVPAALRILVP
ncbi:MAG: diacylglycerol kinase family protein [Acidobacteriota bacterium]|nr:diacylglycerol kinase family protein [Acidobacteriota bacterium]